MIPTPTRGTEFQFSRQRNARGFTLIEILIALAVMSIGLASVLAIIFASSRLAATAVDRNAASMIIPRAVEDIERTFLITPNMTFQGGGMSPPPKTTDPIINEIVLTALDPVDPTFPSIQGSQFNRIQTLAPSPINPDRLAMWPFRNAAFYGGQPGIMGSSADVNGLAYRVIFKIERHPQWSAANSDESDYAGLYVLTMTVYRDPNRLAAKLQQVSDPVVVYLRDKKVRFVAP